MTLDIITIFPAMVEALLAEGVIGRARQRGVIDAKVRDLRDFTADRHRQVDDVPYGGGPGMVMKPEPMFAAVETVQAERGPASVLLMSPQGRVLNDRMARRLSRLDRIIVICGRYEGVDERVSESLVTEEISIGDYVLTGGELPALVLVDAVVRLLPTVVGDSASVEADSFARGWLDHPHYTRPAEFRGMAVPDVLLSGHHAAIEQWRRRIAIERTVRRRPDLVDAMTLSDEERRQVNEIRKELRRPEAPPEAKEPGDEGN